MAEVVEKVWQATRARVAFAEVVEGAIGGTPQVLRRRDGHEVVVVSRDYYERTRPSLTAYLLTRGYAGPADDAFDRAMLDVGAER